nr:sodium-dependent transporter [Halioglobus sp.]
MKTERWSSRAAFLFATIGCAVGLGNLWRFPYIAGENGGGAFVLVYLGFVLMAGIPLIMAELAIARRGRSNPVATTAAISHQESGHRR